MKCLLFLCSVCSSVSMFVGGGVLLWIGLLVIGWVNFSVLVWSVWCLKLCSVVISLLLVFLGSFSVLLYS